MKKILIKYASKGRPELFKETITNILEKTHTQKFEIIVTADIDDLTMNNKNIKDFCLQRKRVLLMFGKSNSKVHAINRDMNNLLEDWDILINMSDDMKFIVDGWDKEVEADMEKTFPDGDGFLHYSDGYLKETGLPTMSIMDKKYYDRTKYIYYPGYQSFSCDAEAMYVAMMLGRHKYMGNDKVLFHHKHPANDKKVLHDETYKTATLTTQADTDLYFKRLNIYFGIPEQDRVCVPFEEHLGRLK